MRGERQNLNQTGNNDVPRSRALGIIILMFALLLFQVGVFLFEKVFRGERQDAGPSASAAGTQLELFRFDPNTICPDSLCLLGFSQKQAESIVKYRNKGGKFRKKSDFAKMYVVSQEKYAELEPYIVLKEEVVSDKLAAGQPARRTLADSLSSVSSENSRSSESPVRSKNSVRSESPASSVPKEAEYLSGHSASVGQKPPLLIDINVADSAAFTRLYGIGGYYAKKIIAYRERLGNFYSTSQLMEIPGIDSVRFEGFAGNVTADPADVKRFSLDTAGKSFLIRHPYVGAYAARGILLMREKFGVGACTLQNLVKEKILAPATAEKLWFYIENSSF